MVTVKTFDDYIMAWSYLKPKEHFAIGFNFYITKGPEFRTRAKENKEIRRVYDFLKKNTFDGKEFSEMTRIECYEAMLNLAKNNKNMKKVKGLEQILRTLIDNSESYKNN